MELNISELKTILREIVAEVDDLRVNEAVLQAKIDGAKTLGGLLEVKKANEERTKKRLAFLRQKIEAF